MSECTPEDLATLTLSGDTSDTLLRYCSPVQFIRGGGCPGVVVGFVDHKGHPNTPLVWWPRDEFGVGKPSFRNSISLDLTSTTGRRAAEGTGDRNHQASQSFDVPARQRDPRRQSACVHRVHGAPAPECWCYDCQDIPGLGMLNPVLCTFIVCPECGNKRCPRATSHALDCTDSNDPAQPGSRFGGRTETRP